MRKSADIADHQMALRPSQGPANRSGTWHKYLSVNSNGKFYCMIAKKVADLNKGVAIRANCMHLNVESERIQARQVRASGEPSDDTSQLRSPKAHCHAHTAHQTHSTVEQIPALFVAGTQPRCHRIVRHEIACWRRSHLRLRFSLVMYRPMDARVACPKFTHQQPGIGIG